MNLKYKKTPFLQRTKFKFHVISWNGTLIRIILNIIKYVFLAISDQQDALRFCRYAVSNFSVNYIQYTGSAKTDEFRRVVVG